MNKKIIPLGLNTFVDFLIIEIGFASEFDSERVLTLFHVVHDLATL